MHRTTLTISPSSIISTSNGSAPSKSLTVGANARRSGAALYLDFPLGVNRDGYDVWREREVYSPSACNGGAPPDGIFVKGQNWGFPPLHPEAIRQQGYRYYIDCLRHHMGSAGMLRIDHVMGLHRAFWVPDGFSATDGVYVHYRARGVLRDIEFRIAPPSSADRR